MRTASLRRVFIAFVAAAVVLAAPIAAEARKIFVREIRVSPGCVAVSPGALLARIAERIPREVLARRGLTYEDLSAYEDIAQWNPERFEVRESENVRRRLRSFDMRYMVWLELSCLPADGTARYLLSGRLTDLDAMDAILACPAAQAGSRDGRRVCNVNGEVFDAVAFTSVEMRTFDDFVPAFTELLARLLHIPEVRVGTATRVFNPSEEIDVPFFVRRNDGTERGFNGPAAPVRGYRMRQDLVQIPSDLYDEVCRDPALRWDQIACRGGFADGRCDPADRVAFEVRSLIHREVPARAVDPERGSVEGGDRLVTRAPSHEGFYLLRAEAIAVERGGDVRSAPVFACLHVRPRRYSLGFASRLGVAWPAVPSDPRDPVYPAPTVLPIPLGIDVEIDRYLFSSRRRVLPNHALGWIVGFTRIAGVYPCDGASEDCAARLPGVVGPLHISTSLTLETRVQFRSELFRVGSIAPLVVSEIGAGIENLSSHDVPFRNDGWGAVLISGVGVGVQRTAGRSDGLGTRIWLLAQYQARFRMPDRSVTAVLPAGRAWIDAAGVPDGLHMLWFSLGVAFAAPDAND